MRTQVMATTGSCGACTSVLQNNGGMMETPQHPSGVLSENRCFHIYIPIISTAGGFKNTPPHSCYCTTNITVLLTGGTFTKHAPVKALHLLFQIMY